MTNHSFPFASLILFTFAACAADAPTTHPVEPPHAVPIDPSGHYAVTSSYALAAPPAAAADVLGELIAATDGPDDPSRYLVDLMIAKLPDGATKTYATALAPYLAAYLDDRIAAVAPKFADGVRGLAIGMSRIAQRFGTSETFDIAEDSAFASAEAFDGDAAGAFAGAATASTPSDGRVGSVRRTIIGFRFDMHAGRDVADVRFAPLGMPDLAASARMVIDGDHLTFDRHAIALPYKKLLRLGFDFAVVPDVVPGAHDLAQALVELVDCNALGAAVSDWMGIGSPSFYGTACRLGLSALAARIYDQIAMIDAAALPLDVGGEAWAVDANGDGPMDEIEMGTWTGSFAGIAVTSSFEGSRR